jgi:threonine/homoserine/homoserine lactone efflux protein
VFGYLLTGAGYGFAGAVQPGPFQAYLASEALRNGPRRTLPAMFAPLLSDLPVILLVLLVLTRLPAPAQRLLNLVSGAYILYLAWGAWHRRNEVAAAAAPGNGQGGSLPRAALMNLLSPGPYVFWSLVAGPVLLRAWEEGPIYGVAFLVGFYGAMIGTLAVLITAFGVAGRVDPRVGRTLISLSALLLAAFGARQLWLGIMGG